jgi:hypothetical protein
MKELLCRYPEWLPIESYMFSAYHFCQDIPVPGHGSVDLFAARPDTGGIRAYMYYFASSGLDFSPERANSSEELSQLSDRVFEHARAICRPHPRTHPLHPFQTIREPSGGMKSFYYDMREKLGYGPYGSVKVYLLAGQRKNPDDERAHEFRESLKIKWRRKLMSRYSEVLSGCAVDFDILSYTRLLQPNGTALS